MIRAVRATEFDITLDLIMQVGGCGQKEIHFYVNDWLLALSVYALELCTGPAAARKEQDRYGFANSSCLRQDLDFSLQILNPHELEAIDPGFNLHVGVVNGELLAGSST